MKKLIYGLVTCALLLVAVAQLAAEDQKQDQPQFDPAAQEAAFKAFATPGKEHEQFKRLAGTWDADCLTFHEPNVPPAKTKAKATFRVLLGGRYLQQQFSGEFDGVKFEGIGLTGYDNGQKKYVGTWIDNMGTGIMRSEGKYNVDKHEMVEIGESSSPAGPMKFKMVTQYVSNDKFIFTMSMLLPENVEQKMMEITYTRAKTDEKK